MNNPIQVFAELDEYGYRVSWALTRQEAEQVHALRAEVFCCELGWVGDAKDTAERDEFDATSLHVAVINERARVVAAVRMTGYESPWMLDSVFRALAGRDLVRKAHGTAEASRLVVARRSRSVRLPGGRRTCDLVYKGAYAYCALNGIHCIYTVTSDVVLRHMVRTGLPCEPLAPPTRMPDGVRALAVKVDWTRLLRNPSLASWYNSGWAYSHGRSTMNCGQDLPAMRPTSAASGQRVQGL